MDIQSFNQGMRSVTPLPDNKANGPVDVAAEMAQTAMAQRHESVPVTVKTHQNKALLHSAIVASIRTGNESMALVLKTAIEGINEALQDTTGNNAIQTAYDSGIDVSPGATAERVVSMSTAFFGQYLQQHPEMAEGEARAIFTEIIRGGIEKGFAEARDILDALGVLQGKIADNIDLTYTFVQEGLASFAEGNNQV